MLHIQLTQTTLTGSYCKISQYDSGEEQNEIMQSHRLVKACSIEIMKVAHIREFMSPGLGYK